MSQIFPQGALMKRSGMMVFSACMTFLGCSGSINSTPTPNGPLGNPPGSTASMTPPAGPVVTAAGAFPDFVTTHGTLKQVLPRVTPVQLTYLFKDRLGVDFDFEAAAGVFSPNADIDPTTLLNNLTDAMPRLWSALKTASASSPPFSRCLSGQAIDSGCLQQDIVKFSRVLHRREPSADQIADRVEIFQKHVALGADAAAQAVLRSMLLSPLTLYWHELTAANVGADKEVGRQSARLWNSLPTGNEPTSVEAFLAAPQFQRSVRAAIAQWLAMPNVQDIERDGDLGESFNGSVKGKLLNDLTAWVAQTIQSGKSFEALFEPRTLDATLGTVYAANTKAVALGILTSPLTMMQAAEPTHRSIVLKGFMVYNQLLCQPQLLFPSSAPEEAAKIADELEAQGITPTEVHLMNARQNRTACQSCHQLSDAFGYALNAFDHYGRLNPEKNLPAVTKVSTTLPAWAETGAVFTTDDSPERLAMLLKQSRVARACFAQSWAESLTNKTMVGLDNDTHAAFVTAIADGRPIKEALMPLLTSLTR
jgi:Protein of unknown function (DUF1588)